MAPRADLFFDANALGNLARGATSADTFAAALDRRSARVIHGPGTAQSLRGDPEKVRRQFQRLADLGLGSAPVGVNPRLMMRREARGVVYDATPTQMPSDFYRLFSDASFPKAFHEVREFFLGRVNRIMQPFADRRRKTEVRSRDLLGERQRRILARAIGGEYIEPGLFDPQDGFLKWVLEKEFGHEIAARVTAAPRQHRVHLLSASLNVLELFAEFMHARHRPSYPWLYVDKDDRTDLNVALYASYGKYLVTDDLGLAGRMNFLRKQGLTKLEVISLREFLGVPASAVPPERVGRLRARQTQRQRREVAGAP